MTYRVGIYKVETDGRNAVVYEVVTIDAKEFEIPVWGYRYSEDSQASIEAEVEGLRKSGLIV